MAEEKKLSKGRGLDIGTMNLVSARQTQNGIKTRRIRDAFLDLPLDAKKMLKLSDVDFVEREDDLVILGDPALDVANMFGKEVRRPLSAGLVSPSEFDSLEVLSLLVKNVLSKPAVENEHCYFSVPAEPVDVPDQDIVYHQGVFERIVTECGFAAHASNEAMAILFSETAKEGFSGIGLSFGAGMVNVALAMNTIEGLSFSVARAGDWIDRGAARSIGSTAARMCMIKEQGLDLNKRKKTREEEAIAFYYKAMIGYALDNLAKEFKRVESKFALPKAIPIVVSGGSSMVGGFLDIFQEVFNEKAKKFPIPISEIRQPDEPLNCVARGLLIQAMQEN